MARLELTLLGGFHASVDSSQASGFDTDKTRALLVYLGVESSRAHSRETLAGLLWPELPEEAARRNLRNSLFKLRQALGEEEAPTSLLRITPQTVQLDPTSDFSLDSADFTRLIAVSRLHRHRKPLHCSSCHDRLQRAADLYRGDFLKGFHLANCHEFEEWLVLRREALHREALDVFSHLSAYHEARDEYEEALFYVYRQLEFEPWREEAHRDAMRLLAVTGQRSAALAQYETCRQTLSLELNAEPSAETTALYEHLKVGDREAGPVLDTRPKHNLPHQLTPFIGRREELARITEQLDSPDYSLISLVGPGGVGKTRLVLQAASEQVGGFDDGVYFIPLASISTPQLLVSSIAQALGLHNPSGVPVTADASGNIHAQLTNYLHDKEMLLVLDNFEQLLGAGGVETTGLLLSILRSAPRTNLLVTSRERLGLQPEFLLDLSGLPLPEVSVARAAAETHDPAELMSYTGFASVQLFVERARQAHPNFSLSEETARGVVDICRLVAGLPLGIVLAAPWVRHLSPARIAESIRANLDFLASSARDASPQHASLRAVFNHSWDLLSGEEQRVLRDLSVFRGGWVEEAAERVAGASLHTLLSLVDKSLLRRDASIASSGRFDIHEVLRHYASEKLDEVGAQAGFPASARERAEVESRHAEHFLLLAEEAERGLTTAEQSAWLQRLEEEHDNLRAVLAWAGEKGEAEIGLRMAGALWRFWNMRGYLGEGSAHLAAVLAMADASAPTGKPVIQSATDTAAIGVPSGRLKPARARATFGAGALHIPLGDLDTARALFEESLAISRELGDRQGMASSLNTLGIVAHQQGNYDAARDFYEESLALRRELGDRWGIASMLNNLGIMAHYQGEYDAASALHKESLALRRELGDRRGIASSLENLGHAAHNRGDYLAATALYEESLGLTKELGDKWGTSLLLFRLGNLAQNKEGHDAARALHEESLALRRELGDKQGIASSLNSLGIAASLQADYDTARALYEESLALRRELGDKWGIASTLNNLGLAARYRGVSQAARTFLEESLALRRELGDKRGIAASLAGLGGLFVERAEEDQHVGAQGGPEQVGQAERATRLFGAVVGLLERMGCVLDIEVRQPYERSTAEAQALLGSEAFEKALAEGKAMGLEEAIAYALRG